MRKGLSLTRLLAEGVMVVVSILLALGVDAWWSERVDAEARQEWLKALEADFETNASRARFFANRSIEDRDLAQRFVSMSDDEASLIPEDSTWAYLRALWRPNPAPLNKEAIIASLEAAPVLAAEDDELRQAIGGWRSTLSYLAEIDAELWEIRSLALSALSDYPEMRNVLVEPGTMRDVPRPVPRAVLARARANSELMNLATRKAYLADVQVTFLASVAEAAEAVRNVTIALRTR